MSAFVQANSYAFTTGSSYANAYPSNNTAGNLLIAFADVGGTTDTLTIADSNSNTWVQLYQDNTHQPGVTFAVWYALNCAGGANTVTVSGTTSLLGGVAIGEWSGVNTFEQKSAITANTGNSFTTASITTAFSNEVVIAFVLCNQGFGTPPFNTPFTAEAGNQLSGTFYTLFADDVNVSAGSISATANFDNNTNSNSGFIASWYQASSGNPTTNALTRLGAGL